MIFSLFEACRSGWRGACIRSFFAAVVLSSFSFNAHGGLVLNGITEPFLDVTLTAPVSGIIREKHFKEGEFVKQGDVILELDKKLEEYELARRKAVMDRSKADLDSTRVLLSTTKSVSKDEAEKKAMDYHVAAAEYGVANEELNRRRIVSPFAGSIAEMTLQAGAACAPYQPLARVVDTSHCYFVGYVEGKAAASLKLDQAVKLDVAGAANPVSAKICFISPVVDPASGLARIKAIFENSNGNVRPGVAARLTIE
jgi:RND family efflux transporter MFP subunit